MSEKNLGTQINDLYLQFSTADQPARLAKRVGALGVSAAAVKCSCGEFRPPPRTPRRASHSVLGVRTSRSPRSPAGWVDRPHAWWAEQDPPYRSRKIRAAR